MSGAYLAAILISLAGIVVLDLRYRLVLARHPIRALLTVVIGTVFFLIWDWVGIATGVFVKGDGSILLGIDLAPELPLEEPFFLFFLCYLALVTWRGAEAVLHRRAPGERT
ncbi:lycopene cyclase domain-containing protein [Enemella sp. A6]|uniref:lycopene cyclase domain-containing protein n=1 Tax=Enemella sp. A6 TaxID=3440152 RepID=UPI003EBC9744